MIGVLTWTKCKDCPDRTLEPNCHSDLCPHGYGEYQRQLKLLYDLRKREIETDKMSSDKAKKVYKKMLRK